MVYDPRNAQNWEVIENPFEEGVTTSLSITLPRKIFGKQGFYGVRGVYSTKDGLDLRDIPALILPPGGGPPVEDSLTQEGYWYFSASVQQYLYQDPDDPSVGWGFFADAAISDGNPNPFRWHVFGGLAGNSPIPGRSADRWGVGYFYYGLSEDVKVALSTVGIEQADEQGIEAFYNVHITP